MPEELSKDCYYLFLEQYYLLNKEFNLNTQKIVNFRVKQGISIYLYDKDGKFLYYYAYSLNGMRSDLGIQHATSTKCIKNGCLYLDYFIITNKLITSNIKAGLSLLELIKLISDKKSLFLKSFSKITSKATLSI